MAIEVSQLIKLGEELRKHRYQFTAITPESHRRVMKHAVHQEDLKNPLQILRQFFGWNRALHADVLPSEILDILRDGDLTVTENDRIKSRVRFASVDDMLFAHSSFPTDEESSVFFGPDSYRFVSFLRRQQFRAQTILDIGAGSGVGALCLSSSKKILCDINEEALSFSKANAQLNKISHIDFVKSDILKGAPAGADLLIANPPFIIDSKNRQYRDGGGRFGMELALRITEESLHYLEPGASLALYTGSPVIRGQDIFLAGLKDLVPRKEYFYRYEELDPDIFGEELEGPAYQEVERIAAVGLVLTRQV